MVSIVRYATYIFNNNGRGGLRGRLDWPCGLYILNFDDKSHPG